jgi:hypothetical protein
MEMELELEVLRETPKGEDVVIFRFRPVREPSGPAR